MGNRGHEGVPTYSNQHPTMLSHLWASLDGLPIGEGETWTGRVDIGTEDKCWLIASDGATLSVQEFLATERPRAEMSVWYATSRLFLRDARGQLTERVFAAEYVKQRILLHGDRTKAQALADVLKRLRPEICRLASRASAQQPPEESEHEPGFWVLGSVAVLLGARRLIVCFAALLKQLMLLRRGRPDLRLLGGSEFTSTTPGLTRQPPVPPLRVSAASEVEASGRYSEWSDSDSNDGTVEEHLARLPWYQRHFGTDLLLSSWLWLLGCIAYLVVSVCQLAADDWSSSVHWCDTIGGVIFVIGCAL